MLVLSLLLHLVLLIVTQKISPDFSTKKDQKPTFVRINPISKPKPPPTPPSLDPEKRIIETPLEQTEAPKEPAFLGKKDHIAKKQQKAKPRPKPKAADPDPAIGEKNQLKTRSPNLAKQKNKMQNLSTKPTN